VQLKPGSRIVAYDSDLGEWRPDFVKKVAQSTIKVWVVPAGVHGRWSFPFREASVKLELRQNFQEVSGSVTMGAWKAPIQYGKLRGSRISFVARPDPRRDEMKFDGRVVGDHIEGVRRNPSWSENTAPWLAKREKPNDDDVYAQE
jgi:hypothetical protein